MKLTLHHINLCTTDVPAMDEFYRSVLGLGAEAGMNATRVTSQGYNGDVAFVTDGTTQVHLAERDLGVGFRMAEKKVSGTFPVDGEKGVRNLSSRRQEKKVSGTFPVDDREKGVRNLSSRRCRRLVSAFARRSDVKRPGMLKR
jgi:catechol 2,3-dioxygenase-like lactoylglutathione lyase family enzyme